MQNAFWAFSYLGMTDIADFMKQIDLVYQGSKEEIDRYCEMKWVENPSDEQKSFEKDLRSKKLFYKIEEAFYAHNKLNDPYIVLDQYATIHKDQLI